MGEKKVVGDLLGIAAGDDLLGGIVLEALRLVNGDCIGQLKGDDRKPKEWSSEIPSSYRRSHPQTLPCF